MYQARVFIVAAALALLGSGGTVTAADSSGATVRQSSPPQAPHIVPPPPPQELTKGEAIEPGVTIIHRDGAEFHEYSAGGRVYAVKVIPRGGIPYWFYDIDGDGRVGEILEDPLQEIPQTVQWQILSW
ncbi:DUF2782 domain-containing protein [Nitrococcus mobilis]|uniref:DUF2782 domain-containing protein n=1 Tax=Nitrococcus mobilis Nb-231 TaxID=314278 RepID=A4BNY4_9GAMM|nr:DUF2782 domain-containing protein [Nitrococcus mobilis]EAR22933.1 hypothetical protein NB231_10783 [Nitrococcus mobilis Nb-231]